MILCGRLEVSDSTPESHRVTLGWPAQWPQPANRWVTTARDIKTLTQQQKQLVLLRVGQTVKGGAACVLRGAGPCGFVVNISPSCCCCSQAGCSYMHMNIQHVCVLSITCCTDTSVLVESLHLFLLFLHPCFTCHINTHSIVCLTSRPIDFLLQRKQMWPGLETDEASVEFFSSFLPCRMCTIMTPCVLSS